MTSHTSLGRLIYRRSRQLTDEVEKDLVKYYGRVWADLNKEILEARRRLDAHIGSANWQNYVINRAYAIQRQIEVELNRYGIVASRAITKSQGEAIRQSVEDLEEVVHLQTAGFGVSYTKAPIRATELLVGNLADGKPLRSLFDGFGVESGLKGRETLVSGMLRGLGPEKIADEMRNMMAIPLQRSLRIARTEVLRTYRTAASESMAENSDVVDGWIWFAALGARTCAMCCAMHGTFHKLDQKLNDHVCGRCVAVPWVKPWKELGIDSSQEMYPQVEHGEEWFGKQPDEVKLAILGRKGFDAYKEDRVTLRDFVGLKESPVWGDMRVANSVQGALLQHGRENPYAGSYYRPHQ